MDDSAVTQEKPKRQLSQAQLDQLAKAREKANTVRKKNAERRKKEKRLKELQKQVQDEELDEEIQSYTSSETKDQSESDEELVEAVLKEKPLKGKGKTNEVKSKKKKKKQKKTTRRKEPRAAAWRDSSDSSSEESDDEPETTSSSEEDSYAKMPSKTKRKVKRSSRIVAPAENQYNDIYHNQMNQAFGSLFPNYNIR